MNKKNHRAHLAGILIITFAMLAAGCFDDVWSDTLGFTLLLKFISPSYTCDIEDSKLTDNQWSELASIVHTDMMQALDETEKKAIQEAACVSSCPNVNVTDPVIHSGKTQKTGMTVHYTVNYNCKLTMHTMSSIIAVFDNYRAGNYILNGISYLDIEGYVENPPCSSSCSDEEKRITSLYYFDGELDFTAGGDNYNTAWDFIFTDKYNTTPSFSYSPLITRCTNGSFGDYAIEDLIYDGYSCFVMQ